MYKNRTKIILGIWIGIAFVSLGTFIFFFRIIQNKNEHTVAVLTTLANKMVEKKNEKEVREKIAEVTAMRDTLISYFVDPNDINSFITYLEDLGPQTDTKVKIENFDINPKTKNTLSVRMSVNGEFSKVMRIILLLENAPYKIQITRTYLNQQSDSSMVNTKTLSKEGVLPQWHSELSFTILLAS